MVKNAVNSERVAPLHEPIIRLEVEPRAGSGDRAPSHGDRGLSSPKAEKLLTFLCASNRSGKFALFSVYFRNQKKGL